MPVELVGAIAYAESEPGIESVAGWVVEALRRHRDEGWPIPTPRTRQLGLTGRDRPIDIETYTSGAYGDLFRCGSDISGLEDSSGDREEEAFGAPHAGALAQSSESPHLQTEAFSDKDAAIAEAELLAACALPESAGDTLTRQIQAELRMRCGRQRGRVIEGLCVHVAGSTSLIIVS